MRLTSYFILFIFKFQLEDLEITLRDQVRSSNTRNVDFSSLWESAETRDFVTDEQIFALGDSITSIEAAIQSLIILVGLEPVERSDRVKSGATQHTLLLSGVFRGGKEVLARAKLVLTDQVTMQFTVRSQDSEIAELIVSSVG